MKKTATTISQAVSLPCAAFSTGKANHQVLLRVLVKPGAKQNHITDTDANEIGVQIAAPPKDGEANDELRDYLCDVLQVKKSQLSLVAGQKSRNKTVLIENISVQKEDAKMTTVWELYDRLVSNKS